MNKHDHELRQAIAYGIGLFKAAYPTLEILEETPKAWLKALEDIEPKYIIRAFEWALRNSRFPALPPIASVREQAITYRQTEEYRRSGLLAELALLERTPTLTQDELQRLHTIKQELAKLNNGKEPPWALPPK